MFYNPLWNLQAASFTRQDLWTLVWLSSFNSYILQQELYVVGDLPRGPLFCQDSTVPTTLAERNALVPRPVYWKQVGIVEFLSIIVTCVWTEFQFRKVTAHVIKSLTTCAWYPKKKRSQRVEPEFLQPPLRASPCLYAVLACLWARNICTHFLLKIEVCRDLYVSHQNSLMFSCVLFQVPSF